MIPKRLFRILLATAMTLGLMSTMSVALAATPTWTLGTPVLIPQAISPGASAGFAFTLHNDGPSNISQLYVEATSSQSGSAGYASVFVKGAGASDTYQPVGSCSLGTRVECSVGALRADQTAKLIVAFPNTDVSTPPVAHVVWETTGLGSSVCEPDPGDQSHGDCKPQDWAASFNTSGDYSGGFSTSAVADYLTNDPAGPNDWFAARLTGNDPRLAFVPITVEDDTAYSGCPVATCFGSADDNAVALNVGDGISFTNPFTLTVNIYKDAVPNGVNAKKLVVVHYYDPDKPHYDTNGNRVYYEEIDSSCPKNKTPTSACRDVSWDGKSGIYTVVMQLFENGFVKFH